MVRSEYGEWKRERERKARGPAPFPTVTLCILAATVLALGAAVYLTMRFPL